MNVLVIGSGMFVCGRGTEGYGTVLPALCEWRRRGRPLQKIALASRSEAGVALAAEKLEQLNRQMGTDLAFQGFADSPGPENPEAFRDAIQSMPRPACAIVVVPDHLHYRAARACIENGLHVLVVKPLTAITAEARHLIELQEARGVYGAVEFHKRFDRANLKIKEAFRQGRIGRPLYVLVEYSQRKRVPSQIFRGWVQDTNIFQYLGVHYVDIIHFVTGAAPRRVMAAGQSGWLRENGIDADDAVHGIVEWTTAGGETFLSFILTHWVDPEKTSAMSDQQIKFVGTRGRIESNQKSRGLSIVTDDGGIEEINPDFCQTYPDPAGGTAYQGYGIDSIHHFLADVMDLEAGRTSHEKLELARPTFKNALAATAVIEAANHSLQQNGRWIEIEPVFFEKKG